MATSPFQAFWPTVATGVDADTEPVARRGGGRHVVARGIHRTLQLAVYVDVGLGLLLVPYAHDVVIAPRLGVDAALRPYPAGFTGRADVGQEGQLRTPVGLADKESGAAARHRTEHLQLGRTVRLLIQLEERLERVPVGERILELLVGRVVGLVEPLVDGRARRVVEMGRIPRIEVVVVGHHRRTFERPHGVADGELSMAEPSLRNTTSSRSAVGRSGSPPLSMVVAFAVSDQSESRLPTALTLAQ